MDVEAIFLTAQTGNFMTSNYLCLHIVTPHVICSKTSQVQEAKKQLACDAMCMELQIHCSLSPSNALVSVP